LKSRRAMDGLLPILKLFEVRNMAEALAIAVKDEK
jgi:hypothetical protein